VHTRVEICRKRLDAARQLIERVAELRVAHISAEPDAEVEPGRRHLPVAEREIALACLFLEELAAPSKNNRSWLPCVSGANTIALPKLVLSVP